jgi:hypothetical protein
MFALKMQFFGLAGGGKGLSGNPIKALALRLNLAARKLSLGVAQRFQRCDYRHQINRAFSR